jgi:hypothetical protein
MAIIALLAWWRRTPQAMAGEIDPVRVVDEAHTPPRADCRLPGGALG